MTDIEAERAEWRAWVRSRSNLELLVFTVGFVVLMSLAGTYLRTVWTPMIIIVGSYLFIDFYFRIVLKFENGVAYFVRVVPKNKMRPISVYFWFITLILATAFAVAEIAFLVEVANHAVAPWVSALSWSAGVGFFLYLDILSLYKESIAPRLLNPL